MGYGMSFPVPWDPWMQADRVRPVGVSGPACCPSLAPSTRRSGFPWGQYLVYSCW